MPAFLLVMDERGACGAVGTLFAAIEVSATGWFGTGVAVRGGVKQCGTLAANGHLLSVANGSFQAAQ